MYLKKIHIENFRLLINVDIVLDKTLTLIVGKNNAGKTSIANLLQAVINEKKNLSFNDYPLECRKQLYEALEEYWAGKINCSDIKQQIPETKVVFYVDYGDDGEDQFLGELRSFIIDMDDTQNVARIDATYSFDTIHAAELFDMCHERYNELQAAKESDKSKGVDLEPDIFDRLITVSVAKEQFENFFL